MFSHKNLATGLTGAAILFGTTSARQIPSGVPSFALDYAPLVYLFSGENYNPSDISAQLPPNTTPKNNFTAITNGPNPLTLDNLSQLSNSASLSSTEDFTTFPRQPSYLYGVRPSSSGQTGDAVSCAIIVNDHDSTPGSNVTDVFYMYFYAFDYGGDYFSFNVGNHVGDWEHTMVRFVNGTPSAMWFSQHANGQAFTYAATEKGKDGKRPIAYSANGTHANYATPGVHDHTLPNINLPFPFLIPDHTSAGSLWDPTLSAYYYRYSTASNRTAGVTGTFTAYDDSAPTDWLYWLGRWGDENLPKSDPRQSCPFGIDALCRWSGGPTGPVDKQLNRAKVCPDNGNPCIVRSVLSAK